jgi:hypothetical protein
MKSHDTKTHKKFSVGDTFGRLTIESHGVKANCKCQCGNSVVVVSAVFSFSRVAFSHSWRR